MGKETVAGRGKKKRSRSVGKMGLLFIGCDPGAVSGPRRAGARKAAAKSPEVLPHRGTRKCKELRWEWICLYKIGAIQGPFP